MAEEFKISRLRFSWVGEWEDQKFFNKDEIVQFEGKAYVCLTPHTSNGFYADLNDVEPKWELMMTGQTWRGPWQPFTAYALDNIVIFGGIVYKANEQHTSASIIDPDIDKWDIYAESKTWASEWTSNTTYGVGDIVNYGGSVYECTVSHISAATDLEGLEVDFTDVEDSTERYWKLLQFGVQWRGEYSTSSLDSSIIRYKLNDIVKYGPSLYRCIRGHAPSVEFVDFADSTETYETFISQFWEEWLPGLDFDNGWDSNAVYQPGDVVLYGGYLFQNRQINNINITPSQDYGDDSTDPWELITEAYDVSGDWNPTTEFRIGSVVRYGGDLYVALTDTVNQNPGNFEIQIPYESTGSTGKLISLDTQDSVDPSSITVGMTITGEGFARGQTVQEVTTDSETGVTTVTLNEEPDGVITDGSILTFTGAYPGVWELLIPGFQWEGRWASDTLYNIDDVVYYGNATYKCSREHVSSLVNRPDLDLQNNFWSLYLQHDQRNSLTEVGELIVFRDGESTALPIGDQATILKVVDGLPQWSDINFTPNVYYVATNGIDAPTRGTTDDTAWATIKYACERVNEGTLKQNAKFLIEQNKRWIIEETFYWFLYQQNQNIPPFDDSYNFENSKVKRDARLIVDAVVKDLSRGGNAQTVEAALSYFDLESTNKFTNNEVAEQSIYFQAFFVELFNNIELAVTNTPAAQSYQELEEVEDPISQYFNTGLTIEADTISVIQALERILLESFAEGTWTTIPPANQSAYSTIFIKSGSYNETLPIVVPCNTALNGDELRGTTVQPANPVNTLCTRTVGFINVFEVGSTLNIEHNTPIQFVSLNPVDEISTILGGVEAGKTYYAIGDSITETSFSVAEEPDGEQVALTTNIGNMFVYGGEALSDMFYVQNATGIRNMTLKGLRGTLSPENEFLTRRPTGGAYVSLDPGTGPDDTRAWITYKSPYIQNVSTFGIGCVGCKIDSTLHNGGNRSMVSNDFTQILSDGIGIWCKGGDALTEAVSVFSYFGYAGYFAEDGAQIRATNGNSSYGNFGVVAEGFDETEIPAEGNVNNISTDASAQAVSALGANAEILKIQYTHSGEEYYKSTTNLLKQSNNFLSNEWQNDGNLSVVRASTTPYDNEFAYKVDANTSLTDSAFFYQDIQVSPQGRTYTDIPGENITGSGVDATFDVTVFSDRYEVSVNNGGSGYVVGNQIRLNGTNFGGRNPENDIIITVDELSITSILSIIHTGTVPVGSALPYNVSIHAKQNSASYFDLYTNFSGYEDKTYYVRFNFDSAQLSTQVLTNANESPTNLNSVFLENGWYRISFTIFDETAQNTSLQFRVYPRGIDGISGATDFYGAQLQIGEENTFFLETKNDTPTSFANINISGAGSGVKALGNELRSGSIYEARLLESADVRLGGLGYLIQTNNAQAGTDEYLTLAQSEVATAAQYEGMRLVVQSGKGAGQFGIISAYDEASKQASITKESFGQQEVTATLSENNRFVLGNEAQFEKFYIDQKVQFTPTFYDIDIESASQSAIQVLGTLGDLNNVMFVSSTDRLRVGQEINFSGETFGGVITGFDYYIIDVIDDRTIQISTAEGGAVWPLSNVNIEDPQESPVVLTGEISPFTLNYPDETSFFTANTTDNMEVALPIQFTGKSVGGVELGLTYYIRDIINNEQFTISDTIIEKDVSETTSSNNGLTIDDTSNISPLNALVFKGNVLGGVETKTKYYVNNIINGTTFSISSDVFTTTATATEAVTNLITVDSTAGFIVNAPIKFIGVTFGGLENNEIYYIQVINDATTFTISSSPGGAAVPLTTNVGEVIVTTVIDEVPLTDETGSMTAVTTGEKFQLEADRGIMEGSFFTEIFGGVTLGTTYYVREKVDLDSLLELSLSETEGGSPIVLSDAEGSMQINAVGWDHINPGTPIVSQFDSTSVYQIEPRITFDKPPFYVERISDAPFEEVEYSTIISNDFKILALPKLSDQLLSTSNHTEWDEIVQLPVTPTSVSEGGNGGWRDGAYGNGCWFILSATGETCLYSVSDGLSWLTVDLPSLSSGEYSSVTYGNGTFVAIARQGQTAAYSVDNCATWTEVNLSFADDDWIDIAYGNETFVAVDGSSQTAILSNDNGQTWTETLVDSSEDSTVNNWRALEFGNNRFVAVSQDNRSSVYSFDGETWYSSDIIIDAGLLKYGQGIFLAIDQDTGLAYTSPDGIDWDKQTDLFDLQFENIGFSFDPIDKKGWFVLLGIDGQETWKISAGTRAIGRAGVTSSTINGISLLEPGSGYEDDSFGPEVEITDPNNSEEALIDLRTGNGSLGAPSFVSFGSGYNTTSTAISIRGSGFADRFQTGLRIIAKNITRFPSPGDNLQFEGNSTTYRVATAVALKGSTAPNLEAEISLSPQITQEDSPAHNTPFTIRSKFSQCRITNHDFLNIGYGNEIQSNYPGLPENTGLEPQDETVEANNGRVFYSSTDQDGNFRVGELFAVEQATGIVTLSASEFGLEGLTELEIGGVALGGSPVTISEFSTDGTFVANSNNIVPTQRAIRTFLASRLSQGGSDTFTGLLTAGTVKVGGPDIIDSTIPEGGEGFQVKIGTKANVSGPTAAWAGDGLAFYYFVKTLVDPTRPGAQ